MATLGVLDIFWWRPWGTDKLRDLSKATGLISDGLGLYPRFCAS